MSDGRWLPETSDVINRSFRNVLGNHDLTSIAIVREIDIRFRKAVEYSTIYPLRLIYYVISKVGWAVITLRNMR